MQNMTFSFSSLPDALKCGEIEDWARKEKVFSLIGIDEAGRGPLAGPVVVAACHLPKNLPPSLEALDDSKRLSPKKREALYHALVECVEEHAIVSLSPKEIDELNILQASLKGMAMAWEALTQAHPKLKEALVLVDGRDKIQVPSSVLQLPLIQGDRRSLHIAAASVLAKVKRDALMVEADQLYPEYGFKQHKGYPTKAHYEALKIYGPSPIHRQSFKLRRP